MPDANLDVAMGDLREFLRQARAANELHVVNGADQELEIGRKGATCAWVAELLNELRRQKMAQAQGVSWAVGSNDSETENR